MSWSECIQTPVKIKISCVTTLSLFHFKRNLLDKNKLMENTSDCLECDGDVALSVLNSADIRWLRIDDCCNPVVFFSSSPQCITGQWMRWWNGSSLMWNCHNMWKHFARWTLMGVPCRGKGCHNCIIFSKLKTTRSVECVSP